jgi:hypothetical protein
MPILVPTASPAETVRYPVQREIPHTSHKRTFASLISVSKCATPPKKGGSASSSVDET